MKRKSEELEEDEDEEELPQKETAEETETRLSRLGDFAGLLDYWRNQTSSLLFTDLKRADDAIRGISAGFKKIQSGWDDVVEKLRQVKSSPKVSNSLATLQKLSSSRNPWRLLSLSMGFVAFAVLMLAMYLVPQFFLPVIVIAFVFLFGLQFYSTFRIRKLMQRNVESLQKYGGAQIEELSGACKDLAQTVISTLTHELPKYGKGSDTFTLRLVSGDYANVKLRLQEKKSKRGRRAGDLYSIVWK